MDSRVKIVLTGATGFLGSFLLKNLVKENYDVVVLKRSFSNIYRIKNLLPKIRYYDLDKVSIEQVFLENEVDTVIHCAVNYGRGKESVFKVVETNLFFSLKLLETALLYNVTTFFNTDTLLPCGVSTYALSKSQFVEWLKIFANSKQIQVINLKLEHMYGLNDGDTKFVNWIISELLQNKKEVCLTKGEQKRDFIYIDDVVAAYMLLLKRKNEFSDYAEFDVCTGSKITIKKFVQKIYSKIKKQRDIDTYLNFGAIPYRKGEIMEINEDTSKLFSLGWKPMVSLDAGVNKIIRHCLG